MQKLALFVVFCFVAFAGWASESLKHQCHLGNAESCLILGFMYENGESVTKNYLKAKEYLKKLAF